MKTASFARIDRRIPLRNKLFRNFILTIVILLTVTMTAGSLAAWDRKATTVVVHEEPMVPVLLPEEEATCPFETFSPDAIDLALVCTHESTFDNTNDCAAIWQVLTWRAENAWEDSPTSFGVAARRYSKSVFNPREGKDRMWVTELSTDLSKPSSWPYRGLPWSTRYNENVPSFRERWFARLMQAQRIVNGDYQQCSEQPIHWGAPYGEDLARAQRAGWRRVDCGDTANAYWAP